MASVAFVVVSVLECLYVAGDIVAVGFRPSGECGTFENPAGLALNLCVAIPPAMHLLRTGKEQWMQVLSALAVGLLVAALLSTRSRTGLICLSFYGVVYAGMGIHHFVGKRVVRRGLYAVLVAAVAVGMIAYVGSHKTESTSGRTFILMRSWELVKEHPLVGHGRGGFEREYMLRQAAYFREHPDSELAVLADEIHHPLNEFVRLWVDGGMAAPVLLLVLLTLPLWIAFRERNAELRVLGLPLVAVFLFSCFSYPFLFPVAWLVVGATTVLSVVRMWRPSRRQERMVSSITLAASLALIVLTVNDAVQEYRWNQAYHHSFKEMEALEEYEELHGYFSRDPYFLYNYAMAAFKRGDLDRADRLIGECGKYRNGYNRELLAGDICLYRHEYADAATHYEMANCMCPVRFAPLEGLYKVYEAKGDTARRKWVAKLIAEKKVKVHSWDVMRIKENCK